MLRGMSLAGALGNIPDVFSLSLVRLECYKFCHWSRCSSLATRTIHGQGLEWNLKDAGSRIAIGPKYTLCCTRNAVGYSLEGLF